MQLVIQNVFKTFDGFVALDRINMDVGEKEFVCLLGPSGCGKTTLLRIIAGLLDVDGGSMTLGGKDLAKIPARERGLGLVFQSYSLFPNMTVAQNVGYGLKVKKAGKEVIEKRVAELLDLIKLPELADRYPHQLSGGQQQRVAIARALAVEPSLLLLDEPLSALDARVRAEMRNEIRDMQRRLGIPTIMVTHDQEEALSMADRIVCMKDGRIEQIGTPKELYLSPKTHFVADFVGVSNIFSSSWVSTHLPEKIAGRPEGKSDRFMFAVRPEQLSLEMKNGNARVKTVKFLGNLSRITVDWNGVDTVIEMLGYPDISESQVVTVSLSEGSGSWVKV